MNILITYDIENDKKRKKISDILEGYGTRVNYSVFELEVTDRQFTQIVSYLKNISTKDDNIRIYHICKNCKEKSFELFYKMGIFETSINFL
jgi:CRISPR-associated protein Cas2